MDILGLKYFISAANHLSFSKAADENYVTQPVVSRKIHELEQEFNCELFKRSPRGVQLTPAGKYFLQQAIILQREYDNILFQMKQFSPNYSGKISIAAPLPGTLAFLPHIIKTLKQKQPNLNICLEQMTPAMIQKAIENDEHDFYICLNTEKKPNFQYHSSKIIEKSSLHLWTTSADHPTNMEEALYILNHKTIYILSQEDSPYTNKLTRNLLADLSISTNSVEEIRPLESLPYHVHSGLGVAVMPYMNNFLSIYDLDTFELSDKYIIEIILIWKELSSNAQLFLDVFNELYD